MIEDDSFLDGVLEFGDGKQYTVTPSLQTAFQLGAPAVSEPDAPPGPAPKEVSADDFDRSWPQSSHAAQHNQRNRDLPPHTTAPSGSATPRTLFNERSNRMEPVPASKTVIPNRWKEEDAPQGFMKRGNSVSHSGVERSLPPHMSQSGMQVLRKPPVVNEASPMEENVAIASPRASTQPALSSRHEPPHFNKQSSETPAHSLVRPNLDTRPSASEPPRPAPRRPDLPPPRPSRQPSDSFPKVTSGRSVAAASSTTTDVASKDPPPESRLQIQTPAEPVLSYEEASKTMMQISAERARQRRQMEEEERIKAQERARQKAADLERELRTPVADTTVLDNGTSANMTKVSQILRIYTHELMRLPGV
jgi:serine/arginine repetitive matrix protein 2